MNERGNAPTDSSAIVPWKGRSFLVAIDYYSGFIRKVNPRHKFYLTDYIGLSYRNIDDIRTRTETYYNSKNSNDPPVYDNFSIHTELEAFTFRWGIKLSFNRLMLDACTGAGVKFVNRSFLNNEWYDRGYFMRRLFYAVEPYNGTMLSLNIGFSIGWRLL